MNFNKFLTVSTLTLSAILLVSISGVRARGAVPELAISPHTFEMTMKRGEVVEEKIKIANPSEIPLPIKAKPIDFTAAEETGQMLFDESVQDPAVSPRFWIKIKNPDFILDPGETVAVNFEIQVPENAEPGGHYGVVLFEPQLPSFYFKEGQPRVIPAVGVLFLISIDVEGLARSSEPIAIAEFAIPEKFHLQKLERIFASLIGIVSAEERKLSIVETSRLPFTLKVKNNDIYHIKPFGKLEILTLGGRVVGETKISKTTVLPGKTRYFPIEFKPEISAKLKKYLPAGIINFLSENFLWGKYRGRLNLETADPLTGNSFFEETEVEFWVFPWRLMLVILAMLLFLLFLVLIRKRIAAAARALVRKN